MGVRTGGRRHRRVRAIGLAFATGAAVLVPVVLAGAPSTAATPVAVDPGPIAEVAISSTGACALSVSGGLFCWGDNSKGMLGDGTTTDSTRPIRVATAGTPLAGKTISHIDVETGRACAVTSDGVLACWGENTFGQLGVGDQNHRLLPTKLGGVLTGATVTDVALGGNHGCALTSTGSVACWGTNGNGQVGDGSFSTAFTPVSVVTAGTPMAGKQIVDVTAGSSFTCATSSDGLAFCWGFGGDLGNGTASIDDQPKPVAVTTAGTPFAGKAIADVESGWFHTCARTTDGVVGCWGDGHHGQLGSGAFDVFTRADIPVGVTLAGTALAGKTVSQLSLGRLHSCAVATDGSAACWGQNSRGQLGDRGTTSTGLAVSVNTTGTDLSGGIEAIAAGGRSTCALSADGDLGCWGDNHTGQLGRGTEGRAKVPAPVVAGVLSGQVVTEVDGGSEFACARTASLLACWGSNGDGQLGDGTTTTRSTPVAVTTAGTVLEGKAIADLAVGGTHACALATDGTLACWGNGTSGRLGNGGTTDRTTPVAVTTAGTALAGKTITGVDAGESHSCAMASDGTVACWGWNPYGQIGDGTTTTRTLPTAVVRTGTPLDGAVTVELALGSLHTCARTDANGLSCWGDGAFGLLGTGSSADALTPGTVTTTGTPLAGKAIADITAGTHHNCARTADGVAACWGFNGYGQLGNGTTTNASAPVAVSLSGALGGGPVAHLEAASNRTCASTTSSALACFGEQVDGSLGNGSNVARSLLPVSVATAGTPLAGQSIAGIAQMSASACARTTGGILSCWGANASGQLGNGVRASEPVPAPPLWAASAATVPGAPTITGAVRGDRQVQLTWSAPASDGGSAITGYVVTPFVGAVAQSPIEVAGTGTAHVVTGLTNGTAYTFRVAARNAVGVGAPSAASSAVTPAGVPTAPTITSATAGDGQVSLAWSAAGANGSSITGYVVTPFVGAVAQSPIEVAGTGTAHVVTGLTNGTAYTFRVAARNAVGVGATSAASAPVTPDAPSTPAPFASWSQFVRRQHQDLTGALPSASIENAQAASLASGALAKGDLIEVLRTSTDNLTNVDPTARLYRAFLGRTPDAGGLTFWLGRRRSGAWTLTRIADSFATSREFVRKYGALSNRQFVTRIYTDVLGRPADPAGVDYWTRKLDTKARTRGGVMVGFSESNEYKRKQANNTDAAVVHIFLLGRAPSASDLATWISRIQGGATRAELATEVLDSEAYATRITG